MIYILFGVIRYNAIAVYRSGQYELLRRNNMIVARSLALAKTPVFIHSVLPSAFTNAVVAAVGIAGDTTAWRNGQARR